MALFNYFATPSKIEVFFQISIQKRRIHKKSRNRLLNFCFAKICICPFICCTWQMYFYLNEVTVFFYQICSQMEKRKWMNDYSSPDWEMTMGSFGLLFGPVGTFSIFRIISKPSSTRPNTTCLLSRKLHLAQVMKNWHPFVSFPLLAIDSKPGESCFSEKFSSGNVPPYMLITPVPSPWKVHIFFFIKKSS